MGESFTINSEATKIAFSKYVSDLLSEHKYLTFSAPRIGADRSMDQNALFHVWATEYAAYRLRKDKRDVSDGELDGMKRIIKKHFTAAHSEAYGFMVYELVNPFTGEKKKDYTSSKTWKRGEMFMVLTWFQMVAAQDGLILESKGQFEKLQRKQHEV